MNQETTIPDCPSVGRVRNHTVTTAPEQAKDIAEMTGGDLTLRDTDNLAVETATQLAQFRESLANAGNLEAEELGAAENAARMMQAANREFEQATALLRGRTLAEPELRREQEPEGQKDWNPILTAVIRGTPEELAEFEKLTGKKPEPLELADDSRGYAWHDSGPLILDKIAKMQEPATPPPGWEELSPMEQSAVAQTAAESRGWPLGELDIDRVAELLEWCTDLAARFRPGA